MADLNTRLKEIEKITDELKNKREFLKAQEFYTSWINDALGDKSDNLLESKGNVAVAFNNRGQLKYLAVDFDGAVEDYDKALQYDPSLSCAHYNRGTVFYRMGYFDKAVHDMIQAARLSPDNQEFAFALEKCKKELS